MCRDSLEDVRPTIPKSGKSIRKWRCHAVAIRTRLSPTLRGIICARMTIGTHCADWPRCLGPRKREEKLFLSPQSSSSKERRRRWENTGRKPGVAGSYCTYRERGCSTLWFTKKMIHMYYAYITWACITRLDEPFY